MTLEEGLGNGIECTQAFPLSGQSPDELWSKPKQGGINLGHNPQLSHKTHLSLTLIRKDSSYFGVIWILVSCEISEGLGHVRVE